MAIFKGIHFPFIKKGKNLPAPVEDDELIKQSIIQILMVSRGERIMRPSFGASIRDYIFENNDVIRAEIVKSDIIKSLGQHEPRIAVKSITLNTIDTTLLVNLKYIVISLQEERTLTLGLPISF